MFRTISIAAVAALALAACGGEAPKPAATTEAAPATSDPAAKQGADLAASLGAMAGGKSNPQMTAFANNFDKVVNTITAVKDEASAKAVGAQLQPIYAEMEVQAKAIDALPESEKSAAAMSVASQLITGGMKMGQHMMSLSPELQAILEKELNKMPEPEELK